MKKSRRLRKSKKGMTLVELVVAIAIVSIVFAAAMGGIVHGYITVAENYSVEEASIKAQGVADTVTSALGKVLEDKTITDYDTAVLEELNGVIGSYSGVIDEIGDTVFYNGITGTIGDFPTSTAPKEVQCAVQKIDSISTSKSGSADVNCVGYKIMVAVPSSQGIVIVNSMVTSN